MTGYDYDQVEVNLQKLFDAAMAEKAQLEEKLVKVNEAIKKLAPIYGGKKKTYSLETLKATSSVATRKASAPKKQRRAKGEKAAKAPKAMKAAKTNGEKKVRIKEDEIRKMVLGYLDACAPNSMAPVEIFGRMVKEGMPNTASFRTRVYGKLTEWSKVGVIRKVGRGVYQSVKVPESPANN